MKMSGGAAAEPPLTVGEQVVVMGKRKGTVKFVGETAYGPGEWVGVELEKPTGTHDGGVNGQRYFTCAPKHGVYVQRAGVSRINSSAAAASQIQSMQRGRKDRQEAEFRRAFQSWNALEKAEENQYLSQTVVSSRVESLLRSYSPTGATVNGNSAASVATAAGVSTNYADWGTNMTVPATYGGPHVKWPLTHDVVMGVLNHVRSKPDSPLHEKYVCEILGRASQLLSTKLKDSVFDLQVPTEDGGKLVICGDTHGQLADFLWVLKQNGEPGPKTAYLMNGDIADRGDYACEIFMIVLLFMLLYPDRVMINRGNHENLEMNRRPAEVGGGFFDEITRKYDASIFMMFQQFFELLPLATVVSKRVLIVHGGLPRREGVLVQHLRTINRRRQCPTTTDSIEDALMFDLMWADPHDGPGVVRASHRGSNCTCFGPDVTKRFLGTNGLSLVIRSHEVPENLRGFEDRHEGRLLTVFTASNYCGSTGNYGAVVVFQSDLSFSVEEHMAPELEAVVREYLPAGSKVVADLGGTKVAVDRGRLTGAMRDEILSKLRERIALAKDDLWWYWSQLDRTDSGKVSAAVWRQGMASGLQLELPWFSLQKDLVEVDEDGYVDYRDFLKRSHLQVEAQSASLGMHEGWEKQIVNKAYEAFLAKDLTLQQVLKTFDADGDGFVSAKEFRWGETNTASLRCVSRP